MLHALSRFRFLALAGAAVALTALTLIGCTSTAGNHGNAAVADSGKTGNQLWSENCGMCHNVRDPGEFSDVQWKVIVNHMRLQGHLTGQEQDKIIQFLQASN